MVKALLRKNHFHAGSKGQGFNGCIAHFEEGMEMADGFLYELEKLMSLYGIAEIRDVTFAIKENTMEVFNGVWVPNEGPRNCDLPMMQQSFGSDGDVKFGLK